MKKNIIFAMLVAAAAFVLTSCGDDDSADKSRITYYATLELNGDAVTTTPVGQPFEDPGCSATLAGEDVSDQIIVSGAPNTDVPGFYTINYSVFNSDGFSASASRKVAVVDPDNFASPYWSTARYGSGGYANLPIVIEDNGDGTYYINDLAGGLYCYGRYPGYEAYGYDFYLEGILRLNADNTIELVEQGDWYWGDPVSDLEGTYDPETGTVSLVMNFSDLPLYVTLTK